MLNAEWKGVSENKQVRDESSLRNVFEPGSGEHLGAGSRKAVRLKKSQCRILGESADGY